MLTDNLYTFGSQYEGTLDTLTDDIKLQAIARVLLPVMPGLLRSAYRKNLIGLKVVRKEQHPGSGGAEWSNVKTVEAAQHTLAPSLGTTTTSPPDVNPTGGQVTRGRSATGPGAHLLPASTLTNGRASRPAV